MEFEKAENIINSVSDAMRRVLSEVSYMKYYKERHEKNVSRIDELLEEVKQLRRFEYLYKRLLQHSHLSECSDCHGDGGFTYDTEYGPHGEMCVTCVGNGFIRNEQCIENE